jgi:hypothetical protein
MQEVLNNTPSCKTYNVHVRLQKEVVWFFCIKANFICNVTLDFTKVVSDENMFKIQCNIFH